MRAKRVGCAWVAAVMLAAAGCQSSKQMAAGEGQLAGGTVSHVVMCWLKDPGNVEQRQKLIDVTKTFARIPGVVSVAAGTPLPSTRPVVDSSFDVAIVIRFKDEASLRAYDANPIHQQAVRDMIRPLAQKLVIYDAIDR